MEAGFEIIKCNFSDGMDFVSASKRPNLSDPAGHMDTAMFEYIRGIGSRYQGITANRVSLDYSTMVSAFFYPLDLSNPDASKGNLPRLSNTGPAQLSRIKFDVKRVLHEQKGHARVNWQGVVDMIVTRYSDRLLHLATRTTRDDFLSDINFLLNPFIDYKNYSLETSLRRCTAHYLSPATPSTDQDLLVLVAVEMVSHRICKALFDAREQLVLELGDAHDKYFHEIAVEPIRELMDWLGWSTWTSCGQCSVDQVCFVAIWPFGDVEDHFSPSCLNNTSIQGRRGYWWDHLQCRDVQGDYYC